MANMRNAWVVLVLLSCWAEAKPSSKLQDSDVEQVVQDLTGLVEKLKLEHCQGDAVLEQYVDPLNKQTSYKLLGAGKKGETVYERTHDDLGKEAVVLYPSEDGITVRKTKRIYVALRRAPDAKQLYFVFYIYLRAPRDDDEEVVQVGGQKHVVEYDSWVNHGDKLRVIERRLGWDECSSSIFVPCRTSQSWGLITPRLESKHKSGNKKSAGTAPPLKAALGEEDENLDFFWDLEDDISQGRGFGSALNLLSGGASAITEAITEALGGVLDPLKGLVDSLLGTNGLIGNLLGGGGSGLLGGLLGGDAVGKGADAVGGLVGGLSDMAGGIPLVGGLIKGATGTVTGLASAIPVVGGVVKKVTGGKGRGLEQADEEQPEKTQRRRRRSAPPTDSDLARARVLQLSALTYVSQQLDNAIGERLLKADLTQYPGWKTLDHAGMPNDTLFHESEPFVGFGTCKFKRVHRSDYDEATSAKQIVNLLATALRTYCINREDSFYAELMQDGYIVLNQDKTFDLPLDNKYVKRTKLSPRRRSELTRAFELVAFSKAFKAELYNDSPLRAPFNASLSRRVQVLGKTALHAIELARTALRHHEVKLLRSLAITLKTAFMKLLQDRDGMQSCSDSSCELDVAVNAADEHYLMALMKFIMNGLGPLDKAPHDLDKAFSDFNATNAAAIQSRVNAYL